MNFTALTSFIDSLPDRGIPGCDCAIHVDGREVFRHAAGYADRENGRPAGNHALYNLYSVSKVITATAGMQLIERGKILPAEPLFYYFPEFEKSNMRVRHKNPDGSVDMREATQQIRVRDLFCMSAGFSYKLDSGAINEVIDATGGRAPTLDIVRAMARHTLEFEPGQGWQYSVCHDILGGLIELVSGMKLGDYMRENIFAPLGMEDTFFELPPEKAPQMAAQYRYNDEKRYAELTDGSNSFRLGSEYQSGGAGLISSVEDYILFASALACGGVGENGARILRADTIDLMRTDMLCDAGRRSFDWLQFAGYGYGYGVRTMINPAFGGSYSPVGEFGWGGAAGAYVMIDPSNRLALYYAQHMLNNMEPYVHPHLRNFAYQGLRPF